MNASPQHLRPPATDPTPTFDAFRGSYATEVLAAAVADFDLFRAFDAAGAEPPGVSFDALRARLGLAERPAMVLLTALCALGLLTRRGPAGGGSYAPTPLATEHLSPGGPHYVGDYLALAAESPGVRELAARLRSNRPAGGDDGDGNDGEGPTGAGGAIPGGLDKDRAAGGAPAPSGTAFIYREGTRSAMDREASARRFTLALAGRARNVAPVLADRLPLDGAKALLDVGGGTGIYSFAFLQRNPTLRAVVWDRPEVLKVAQELAREYGVAGRAEFVPGDMFRDPPPAGCDVALLSNVLHDWDVPECRELVARCAAALPAGGRLLVHDVFLHDTLDGPLPVALYSAALFCLTEGRAYSVAEYESWLRSAGLECDAVAPTLVHCGVLAGTKH